MPVAPHRMATQLSSSAEDLRTAGALLRSGGCVAFPTETVYGLGANALDAAAVLRIFEYKGRPLTDPLIVHVGDAVAAEACVLVPAGTGAAVFRILAARFWPGPLTIVARAQERFPTLLSAGTGWLGVRVPAHPVALALLAAAATPVAAPSANRFGHVSPTRPEHVLVDLGHHPIAVIASAAGGDAATLPCAVGIESTVVKLWEDKMEGGTSDAVRLTILRRGGVSMEELAAAVAALDVRVDLAPDRAGRAREEAEGDEAPGQAVTHYAPDVEAMLVTSSAAYPACPSPLLPAVPLPLSQCVVLDFGGVLARLAPSALAYRDLSPSGDVFEARACVFAALRWTEGVQGARLVLLTDPLLSGCGETGHAEAVRDRLYRAASGRLLALSAVAE